MAISKNTIKNAHQEIHIVIKKLSHCSIRLEKPPVISQFQFHRFPARLRSIAPTRHTFPPPVTPACRHTVGLQGTNPDWSFVSWQTWPSSSEENQRWERICPEEKLSSLTECTACLEAGWLLFTNISSQNPLSPQHHGYTQLGVTPLPSGTLRSNAFPRMDLLRCFCFPTVIANINVSNLQSLVCFLSTTSSGG